MSANAPQTRDRIDDAAAAIADAIDELVLASIAVHVDGTHPQYLQAAKRNLAQVLRVELKKA